MTPQLTAYLMLHGGSDAVFWQTLSANVLALVLFLIKFDALAPHQSYLILKQREMVSNGLDDKDLRLLDSIDHTALLTPLDPHNNRYNISPTNLFFNHTSLQEKDPNNSL